MPPPGPTNAPKQPLGPRRVVSSIPAAAAGKTLSAYLAARFTYKTVSEWRSLILAGRVLLDGAPSHPDQILAGGETVRFVPPDTEEPAVDSRFRILFEDAHLLVVEKPGNLPCHPGGRFFRNTLWAFLHEAGYRGIHFINRLDRETSGLVLIARTPAAARDCRRQQGAGAIGKIYYALVEGNFQHAMEARGWIGPRYGPKIRKKQWFFPETAETRSPPPDFFDKTPRFAATRIVPVACSGEYSLIRVLPRTGRLHQIRATLAALGHPIVGDKLYGVDPTIFIRFVEHRMQPADWERLRIPRQALHAAEIRLRHPKTRSRLEFSSPLPEDLTRLIDSLKSPLITR